MEQFISLHLSPMFPAAILSAVLAISMMAMGMLVYHRKRINGWRWRFLALALFVVMIAGVHISQEDRVAIDDVIVVVVDHSLSQKIGERTKLADAALDNFKELVAKQDRLSLRIVETDSNVITALNNELNSIIPEQLAGALLITDGQVHDVTNEFVAKQLPDGPVHVLISGQKKFRDRQVIIEKSPSYTMVDEKARVSFRVRDFGFLENTIPVHVQVNGRTVSRLNVRSNTQTEIGIDIKHAGPSAISISADAREDEVFIENNTAVTQVNGIRDRLRVLLVSGQPHAGERVWRNLLKSDPAIDLVHFTILRPPEKIDPTPADQLALIPFPVHELFDQKINEFDLIIFDRYQVRYVLAPGYFSNVKDYVENGGALLVVAGPAFAGQRSLAQTAVGDILPLLPTGNIRGEGYLPHLNDNGKRHSVTGVLQQDDGAQSWGKWLRQIMMIHRQGDVLLEGVDQSPLLAVDRIGEGRVAVMASDNLWLWARGYDGGGPHVEIVRRLAHWLMAEPSLEANRLDVHVEGQAVVLNVHKFKSDQSDLVITDPNGQDVLGQSTLIKPGHWQRSFAAIKFGLFHAKDGDLEKYFVVGDHNPKEFAQINPTSDLLQPVADQTSGGMHWLEGGMPDVRFVKPGRDTSGLGWVGFRRNDAYDLKGVKQVPLLPAWIYGLLIALSLGMAWWREGR